MDGLCPILVLTTTSTCRVRTTVLGRPRRTDAKNDVKTIRGQLLLEKMRFENTVHQFLFSEILLYRVDLQVPTRR